MNTLFDIVRERFITAAFQWSTMNAALIAWRGGYVFNALHETPADIALAGGERVVESLPLTGLRAESGGYAASDTAILPAVPTGAPVTFLTLVNNSDPGGTLIAYIDDAEGLPFTPNGLDQPVEPDWLSLRGWFRG